MKKLPRVSILILNHNGIKDTRVCLNSLIRTTYPNFEVLLIDNGSTRNEAKILLKEYSDERIKFIRFEKNLGFAGGNNKALKEAGGKYVVLLNNDTFVQKDWLGYLVPALGSDGKIAVAQPKILWASDKRKFDYSGASGGFIDAYGYPFTRGRVFETLEEDRGQYDDVKEIFWASGAALIFKKSVLSKTGQLFDEHFFNYMEEIDFCWRVWNSGYKVIVVPSSVIYHKVAATAKKNLVKKRFYEHRNNLLLLVKDMPINHLTRIAPVRIFLEVCTYLLYLISGKFNYVIALFLAHVDFVRLLPTFWRKRRIYTIPPPYYKGNIVIEYFIKKRKYFWQLDWLGNGKGERTFSEFSYLTPTFNQHQAVYDFCLKFVKDKEVVDLGCGSGNGTFRLSKIAKKVIGIDLDYKSVKLARRVYRNQNLKFYTADILKSSLNFPFDVGISLQVVEHLEDPYKYLHNINNSLKPGGLFIISTPNRTTQSFNENPYHIREYTAGELKEMLKENFSKVNMYGLFGDKYVQIYEKERKRGVMKVMKLDVLEIRRILPRKIKIYLFEFFIPFVRNFVAKNRNKEFFRISASSYRIKRETKGAIDLIAVCEA